MMKLPALGLSLFLMIGIAIEYFWSVGHTTLILSGIAILMVCYLLFRKNYTYLKISFLYLVVLLIGILSVQQHQNTNRDPLVGIKNSANVKLDLHAKVIAQWKDSQKYHKYLVRISDVQHIQTSAQLLLYLKKETIKTSLDIGDIIRLSGYIHQILAPVNPYEFNYQKYLQNQSIYWQIFVNKSSDVSIISHDASLLENIQNQLNHAIDNAHLSDTTKAFTKAFLLGNKSDISNEIRTDFINSGIIHILAISGLHIFILIGILQFILYPIAYLKRGKLIQSIIIVILLWSYALLVGMSPSVVRTVSMFSIYVLGRMVNRKAILLDVLIAALFFNLLFDPLSLFSIGFQFSYLAILSISLFQPFFEKLAKPSNPILKYFYQSLSLSISVQILIIPLQLYYFHQLSLLVFIANIIIIPLLPIVMGAGILTIITTLILPLYIAIPIHSIYDILINRLIQFIQWLAQFDTLIFKHVYFNEQYLLLSIVICYLLYLLSQKFSYYKMIGLILTIIVFQSIYLLEYFTPLPPKLVLFNQRKGINIGYLHHRSLEIYTDSITPQTMHYAHNYIDHQMINHAHLYHSLKNYLSIGSQKIVFIDSDFKQWKSLPAIDCNILYLRNMPKINIERAIKLLSPNTIVVDGSNYSYYKYQIADFCQNRNIIFYDLSQGYLSLEL